MSVAVAVAVVDAGREDSTVARIAILTLSLSLSRSLRVRSLPAVEERGTRGGSQRRQWQA